MTFDTMESLKTIPITVGSGDVIHLEDVANIYSNLEDPAGIGRYNGKDTISLGIKKQQEASAGEVSKSVNSTIERLKRSNPNLEIVVVNDSSDSINSSLESVMTTMVMAVIISMVIILPVLRRYQGVPDRRNVHPDLHFVGSDPDEPDGLLPERYYPGKPGAGRWNDGG